VDWVKTAAGGAGGAAFGSVVTTPRSVRMPSTVFGACMGVGAGVAAGFMHAQSRLMGYSPHSHTMNGAVKRPAYAIPEGQEQYLTDYAARNPPTQ